MKDAKLREREEENLKQQKITAEQLVFLAAERTFLMWIRTSGTLIVLGFALDRFAVYLEGLILNNTIDASQGFPIFIPALIGTALVAIGSLIIAVTAIRYSRFFKGQNTQNLPPFSGLTDALFLAWSLFILGLILTFYLIILNFN